MNRNEKTSYFPMYCTAKEECEKTAKYWLEVEVNFALSCEEHYNWLRKLVKVYSEGLLPKTQKETRQLIDQKLKEVTVRLIKRGIKNPKEFRLLENEILKQIQNITPKRFDKLRKQYARLGANDDDLKMIDERYQIENIIANKDGLTHPPCTCGKIATWWFLLRTRKVFRCEKHKNDIESPVYDQGIIPNEGIPTTDNDFHQRIDDYLRGGDSEKPIYSFEELVEEIGDCEYCNKLGMIAKRFLESDSFSTKRSITFEVYNHIKNNHPKHHVQYTATKDGIEHSFILEESNDFFENFIRSEARVPIPEKFVGQVLSGDVRDQLLLQNTALRLRGVDGVQEHIDQLVSVLKKQNLQPITVCRLLQNLDMLWEIKYNVMHQLFGDDNAYTQYIKRFEDLAKLMESCTECMSISVKKEMVADKIKIQERLVKHFKESHPKQMKLVEEITHEINLEQKYPLELREKVAIELNKCYVCNEIINDEEIPDKDAEKVFQKHVKNHHKEIEKLGVNVDDIIIRPEFLEGGVARQIKLTTISDEKRIKKKEIHYQIFLEFKDFIKDLRIYSKQDWITQTKTKDFPATIPIKPEKIYPEFTNYPDVFGYQQKIRREPLTVEKLSQIIKDFGERWLDYREFPDAFLLNWFSKQGLLTVHDPYFRNLFKNFVQWRNDPEGIKALRYWITTEDYQKEFEQYSLHPKKKETTLDYIDRQKTSIVDVRKQQLLDQVERLGIDGIIANTKNVVPKKDEDPKWYWTQVQFRIRQIWEDLFDEEDKSKKLKSIMDEKKKPVNEFHDDVMHQFWNEWNKVQDLDYKRNNYSFGQKPMLIQLYVAYKMKQTNGFFTMSSTGTGKTGQEIISAVANDSKCCLMIVPNPIVEQVGRNIRKFYKECYVSTIKEQRKISKNQIPNEFFKKRKLTSFYVVNYDLFRSKTAGEKFIQRIKDLTYGSKSQTIDFVVLDESHFVKISSDPDDIDKEQRKISNRRKNIEMVVNYLRNRNRKLKTLMATATPTVNNILEAKSQLEMVTGTKFSFSTHAYIKNAISCYVEFIPYSLSYVKHYHTIERGADKPIVVDAYLPEHLTEEQKIEIPYLELEQIATKYRVPKIVELIRQTNGGVVVYTDYRTGIEDQLSKAIHNAGFKVGFFTGSDKSGLEPFKKKELDVLIATRPFAVGIDEVQYNCNTLIFNGLVWTWAMFEQIRGRLIREGQDSKYVDVHLVFAKIDGFEYDEKIKYNRILAKKALGDCIRDGTLPEELGLSSVEKDRKNALKQMIENGKSGFPNREETERKLAEQGLLDLQITTDTIDQELETVSKIKDGLDEQKT